MAGLFQQDNVFLITAAVILFSLWILSLWVRPGKPKLRLPPGPPGWPIVKNLPVFLERPAKTFDQFYYTRMAKEYGDIYKLEVGSQMQYVLANIDQIREAFAHSHIQGRLANAAFQVVYGPEAEGLIFSSGPVYKAMKQITTNVFRELGVGRGMFEDRIRSETQRFAAKLDCFAGEPCSNINELLSQATCNITCFILFGHQFEYKDPEFKEIVDIMLTYAKSMGPGALAMNNKTICKLPFGPGKALRGCLVHFREYLKGRIEKAKLAQGTNFVKAFLLEMEKGETSFNEGNLNACGMDLFFSATETVSSTLTFVLIYLTNCPEAVHKCQQELDEYVKKNGMPSPSDSSKLPFTMAVIHETQRMVNAAIVGAPHVVEKDLELFGYDFPKGTVVISNFVGLLNDPKEFPVPSEFQPERFIEGGEFKPNKTNIPFSVGRRACLGEQLAKMELFIFLTELLYRYTFTASKDTKMPSNTDGVYGGTRIPPQFSLTFTRRAD